MRRTKNCVFKYRVNAAFRWADGTAVSDYSENREKQTMEFRVSFGIRMEQIKYLSEFLGTEDFLLTPIMGDDTDIRVLVRGVTYPAPR